MSRYNQRTLRRKLHKKCKRKPYRRCSECGRERVRLELVAVMGNIDRDVVGWRLFKVCNVITCAHGGAIGCGHKEELFRASGGTGRHIPQSTNGDSRVDSERCAGSTPALPI